MLKKCIINLEDLITLEIDIACMVHSKFKKHISIDVFINEIDVQIKT